MVHPTWEGNTLGIADQEDLKWVTARLTPHPIKTFQQPARFGRAPHSVVPCTFIACEWVLQTYGAEGMHYVELSTARGAMYTAPRKVADMVHKHRPLSGSCRTARGLSLSDVADPQEKSRVYSGSSDDHEAMASWGRCLAHTKCTVNGPISQFIIQGGD
jgi:hypothetical protein